jgi:hypothetical protein
VTLFATIRAACAAVAERARFVRIDDGRLGALARELVASVAPPAALDPAHHHLATPASTLAFVITLDAVNFGSGWFPHLRKRPGCSGYFTIATALKEHFDAHGPMTAAELRETTAARCAALFGQDPVPPVDELMEHFAEAWRDLGELLETLYGGDFGALVAGARGSAEALVGILSAMPLYRDVSRYGDLEVPLYKRAQLTCADLSVAFAGRGPGAFADLDALTIFADNLVPHVLRMEGVLRYDPELLGRIEAGELIEAGSPEEVEIRAVALHAVERMVADLRAEGIGTTAHRLDWLLWNRGQSPAMKAHPRHRTRSVYY